MRANAGMSTNVRARRRSADPDRGDGSLRDPRRRNPHHPGPLLPASPPSAGRRARPPGEEGERQVLPSSAMIVCRTLQWLPVALLLPAMTSAASPAAGPPRFDEAAAERFANLALACVHKAYPTKIAHVMNGDADVKPARELPPSFYGCYDWHSAVHGHWLLVRLTRQFPGA